MESMKLIKSETTGISLVSDILSKKINIGKFELGLTIQDTFSKPLLRYVFKNDKSEMGFVFVTAIIKRFADTFGFSNKMTPNQVESLTIDALEHFSYESIEDLILFFKMARSGKFGTTHRGVDSNLIFGDWFPKYLEIKSITREENYCSEKSNYSIDKRGSSSQDVFKHYQKQAEKTFSKKVSDYVDKITINMDRQILEDTIVDWQKDDCKKNYVYFLKAKRRVL